MQIIPPPLSISNYTSNIVVIENCNQHSDVVLPLIANGYPGITFQTTNTALISSRNKKIDTLFLYGQNVKPVELYTTGQFSFIAYFFYPHILKTLFGFNAKELTDINIDLNILQPAKGMNLKEILINATSLSMRLQLMDSFVLKISEPNYSDVNNSILFATQAIRKSKGLISLKKIQSELKITERTFQRLFEFHVGVSPKMFSRICQFHSAFQQLNQNQFSKFTDVAYENGYADQSHFNRVFKEFTTYTPKEYFKKCSNSQF